VSSRTEIELLKLHAAGLSRVLAAIYVGVSPSKFDEMVADGRMPKPKRVDARKIWLRRQLDLALEALPGDGNDDTNPWESVR